MKVGDVYRSNFWGDVEILKYESSKTVTFKFINTGNIYAAQKHNIESGLVKDMKEFIRLNELHRQKLKRPIRVLNWILVESRRNIKYIQKINKPAKDVALKNILDAKKAFAKISKLDKFRSKIRCHSVYGEYKVGVETDIDGVFEYTFVDSGFTGTGALRDISMKNVRDLTVSEEEYALRVKLTSQKWYDAHREERIEAAKKYQKVNKDTARNANRRRRAVRKKVGGSFTKEDLDRILSNQNNKCTACSITLDDTKHLDHIMPVCKGGTNDPENLQWLCQTCNNMKGGKLPEEWFAYILTDTFKERRSKYNKN